MPSLWRTDVAKRASAQGSWNLSRCCWQWICLSAVVSPNRQWTTFTQSTLLCRLHADRRVSTGTDARQSIQSVWRDSWNDLLPDWPHAASQSPLSLPRCLHMNCYPFTYLMRSTYLMLLGQFQPLAFPSFGCLKLHYFQKWHEIEFPCSRQTSEALLIQFDQQLVIFVIHVIFHHIK